MLPTACHIQDMRWGIFFWAIDTDRRPASKPREHTASQMSRCINIRESVSFLYIYAMPCMCFGVEFGGCAMIFQSGKAPKTRVFGERKTRLRHLPDAIMMLTFFDAVVIAIATCSHRDSNMMLSTCVHVVINLATCCQVEGASL